MKGAQQDQAIARQKRYYDAAAAEFRLALDRLAAGYEADAEKRRDLRQEIHFQLWKSFAVFDARCSLKTWTLRVAHNTAVSYVNRERRKNEVFVGIEDMERLAADHPIHPEIDRQRSLNRLSALIHRLKPLDRQIILSYLEEMDASAIAEITGLSPANVSMKIHRIKSVLAREFHQEKQHV